MTYIIEDSVPLPKVRQRLGGFRSVLTQMSLGQSVFVDDLTAKSVRYTASQMQKSTGLRFTVRNEGSGVRVWRVE